MRQSFLTDLTVASDFTMRLHGSEYRFPLTIRTKDRQTGSLCSEFSGGRGLGGLQRSLPPWKSAFSNAKSPVATPLYKYKDYHKSIVLGIQDSVS